jgi:hypothetical protein
MFVVAINLGILIATLLGAAMFMVLGIATVSGTAYQLDFDSFNSNTVPMTGGSYTLEGGLGAQSTFGTAPGYEADSIGTTQYCGNSVIDDGAGFKNFWEAQDRAKEWKLIIQAIAELTGEDFEKIQTVSWNSGCPEIGVWVKGGITFINAIKAFGKIVSQLKYLKDSIIGNKEKAKDLGGDGESLKVFQEGIERNILGIYQEKKSTSTIELKRTFGKNSKRPDGDGNNFLEMAFEKAVQQLVDGVRIVDPEEITPIPVTVNRSDGILPEPTIGELYRKQFEQEESLQQYIEAETQKRLAERTKLMKQELGIIEEKDESVAEELNEQSQNKDENTNTSQQDELFEEPVIVSEDLAAKPSKK